VVKSHGHQCGDIELAVAHDRFVSNSDPTLNGRLHYNDIDKSLNEVANDKIRKYHVEYNNNPPNAVAFMSVITGTNGRLHSDFIRLLFLQDHRETDRFFASSGVQSAQSNLGTDRFFSSSGVQLTESTSGLFHFHRFFCLLLIDKARPKDKTYI
jgi:hypothetical protein